MRQSVYAESILILQRIYTLISIIIGGEDDANKWRRQCEIGKNWHLMIDRYLSTNLRRMGFIIYDDDIDTSIIPLLLFNPAKIPVFSRECLKSNIAVVIVAHPVMPMISSRARFLYLSCSY
ncbi:103_t:CDS:1 [Entrophospora sp. SA101]|nr:103_t:CDS:1 [Entrophospora sp. SA101]